MNTTPSPSVPSPRSLLGNCRQLLPTILGLLLSSHALAQSNSTFANRTILRGDNTTAPSVAISGSSNPEPGEPSHSGRNQNKSVWWEWVAPQTATYVVDTAGSAMNTVLAIYEGTALDQLRRVTSNDDAPGTYQAKATLTTTAGTAYKIMVAPKTNAPNGNIALSIAYAGPSAGPSFTGTDSFNHRPKITAAVFLGQAESWDSNKAEPSEPVHLLGERSYWWQWTAPANGTVTIDLRGENIDAAEMNAALTVYAGTAIHELSRVCSNDDAPGTRAARVTFPTAAGQVYQLVAIPGTSTNGTLRLSCNFSPVADQPAALPGHDDFYLSPMLVGNRALGVTDTTLARGQNLEPRPPGATGGTIWWKWTAPANGVLEVDTAGSLKRDFTPFDTVLGIYRGAAIDRLALVATNDNAPGLVTSRVSAVNVTAGEVYHIVVASRSSDGNVLLNLVFQEGSLTPPVIQTQPQPKAVATGNELTLSVSASGGALSYQWQRDGVSIPGATSATYTVPNASLSSAGRYQVLVSNAGGTVKSEAIDVRVTGRLVNLSVRTTAGSGDDTLIVGFSLSGGSKHVLLRGVGPTLGAFGVANSLADSILSLQRGQSQIATNDNWGGSISLKDAFASVGAFALQDTSLDAAIYARLAASSYTVQMGGKAGATGIGLLELYDAGGDTTARLVNLSARCQVGTGDNVLIVGFNVTDGPVTLLVRGVGPTLGAFGVDGTLTDPKLQVFNGATTVAENDNWDAALADSFRAVGAFGLTPGSRDAAVRVTLQPGSYTVQLSGVSNATGVALVEVYELP